MQIDTINNKTLEEQIEEINIALKEIENVQKDEMTLLQKNHSIYMKKMDKLQEYNKIADMTNQVFEKRLLVIENAMKQINAIINASSLRTKD